MMINDDLNALSRLPQMFGAASARLESGIVYGVLMDNAAMNDGTALFHADHGNLGTPGAPSETTISELEQAMMNQKGLDDLDYINVSPSFIVSGTAYKVTIQKLLSSVLSATTSNVNVYANAMTQIVDPNITGNKWYMIANPGLIDTIETGYLEGMKGPQLSTNEQFNNDSVEFKCKHIFAAKSIDHRGMTYNAGA